jgi:hypothetical protein
MDLPAALEPEPDEPLELPEPDELLEHAARPSDRVAAATALVTRTGYL